MKTSFLTTILLSASILVFAQTPTFEWAKNIGGFNGNSVGKSLVVDLTGNVYAIGSFQGIVDFDPGVGLSYLSSPEGNAAYVTKKDALGNLIWAKQLGGRVDAYSIAINSSGDICIVGSFTGTADFDPGTGFQNLTSAGGTDIFVVKLNNSGNLIWAHQFGTNWDDLATSVALDALGNVYTTGGFRGNVDFDPGAGVGNLNSGGNSSNGFISKLNSGGGFVFVKQLAGGISNPISLTLDQSGNIYVGGYFFNTVDFDPGSGVYNLIITGQVDLFVLKLNSTGNFVWVKQIAGTEIVQLKSMQTDALGNVYGIGDFSGTADFDPGSALYNITSLGSLDIFLFKLDASGNFIWAKSIGGLSGEFGNSLFLDGTGNLYCTGDFGGTIDFDPGAGIFNLAPAGRAVFVLKLSNSGTFVWAKAMGGDGFTYGNSVAVDPVGNVYTTGSFMKTFDCDPGTTIFNLIAATGNFMFLSKFDPSGNFVWAHSAGGASSIFIKAMKADQLGNIYTTGYFSGIVDFDPGPGVFHLSTALTDVEGDVFITKCNAAGNLLWAKQLGGLLSDYSTSIDVDAVGNVYTAGSFEGTADFDPGAGTFNLTASSSNSDIFVSKLNSSGIFVWAKRLGTTTVEDVYSIALDASGNLFTAGGYFPGTNSFQIYLNKLDPAGNLIWSKTYGGPNAERAYSIEADPSGNIYFTGIFSGTVDFDPGPGVFNMTAVGTDVFVSKLDGSGNFLWATHFGGPGYINVNSIALNASGTICITGTFDQPIDFDPGPGTNILIPLVYNDIYISKFDNSGNFLWVKQFAGNSSESCLSVATDVAENVYTTGTFGGAVDFDPGPGVFNLNPVGNADVFISKLDAGGNFVWVQQIGSVGFEQAYSIALDGSNNIISGGIFYDSTDFDPTVGIFNLASNGNPDIYIQKLRQCAPFLALVTPAGPTTFCSGGSVTLNASSGSGLTYQWQRNGISIPGAVNSSYVASTPGNYRVLISSSSICMETSNNIRVTVPCIPIGPNQNRFNLPSGSDEAVIKLYPNPTTGIFVIHSPEGKLEVINSYGQLMRTYSLTRNENTFDLSDLPNGIYILKLNTGKSSFTEKIILNH